MHCGLVYCSPSKSIVFDEGVLGGEHGTHPRARYRGSLSTLFFLSFLFALCVHFYLFDFLVSFAARFSGDRGN